jgi:RNA polymerase sigma factor (sigma-70 family)
MVIGRYGRVLRQRRRTAGARTSEGAGDGALLSRFVADRDQAAFAALVDRHGLMVLGVCRRILRDWHDAEEAFQATFLVLARKAATLAQPDSLGNWLYGVAFRTAVKAKARAARRRAYERQAAAMAATDDCPPEQGRRELRELLDDELSRLPAKYRAPLVLCYLEGKTNEEAARELGCPAGSMSWRLARGRDLLRERLAGRGTPLVALPPVAVLTPCAAEGLPAGLVLSTLEAVARAGTGAASLPASLAALVEEVLKALSDRPPRWVLVLLLALLLGGAGAVFASGSSGGGPPRADPCCHGDAEPATGADPCTTSKP